MRHKERQPGQQSSEGRTTLPRQGNWQLHQMSSIATIMSSITIILVIPHHLHQDIPLPPYIELIFIIAHLHGFPLHHTRPRDPSFILQPSSTRPDTALEGICHHDEVFNPYTISNLEWRAIFDHHQSPLLRPSRLHHNPQSRTIPSSN